MQRELKHGFFYFRTVSVVSLGAKPAQAEESVGSHIDLTLFHSCTLVSLSQTCRAHLVTLPTHSRWLKVRLQNRVPFDSVCVLGFCVRGRAVFGVFVFLICICHLSGVCRKKGSYICGSVRVYVCENVWAYV